MVNKPGFPYVDNAVERISCPYRKQDFSRAFNVAWRKPPINEVFRTIRGTTVISLIDETLNPNISHPEEISDSLADLSEVRDRLVYNPIIGFMESAKPSSVF